MKVAMSEEMRKMCSDPNGIKALWEFLDTTPLYERKVVTYMDESGKLVTVTLKLGTTWRSA